MHKLFIPVLVAGVLLAGSARAQDATVATPSSPASVATQQPAETSAASTAAIQPAPSPNQVIYAPRLPNPSELASAAQAQGLAVEQINQSSNQVTVVYRNNAGQLNTVAYELLPTPGSATTTVVTPSAPPTVIYQQAPQTVYYDTYGSYYPRYYYPPVSLNFGFGYYGGWGRGGWGGHHHHWR